MSPTKKIAKRADVFLENYKIPKKPSQKQVQLLPSPLVSISQHTQKPIDWTQLKVKMQQRFDQQKKLQEEKAVKDKALMEANRRKKEIQEKELQDRRKRLREEEAEKRRTLGKQCAEAAALREAKFQAEDELFTAFKTPVHETTIEQVEEMDLGLDFESDLPVLEIDTERDLELEAAIASITVQDDVPLEIDEQHTRNLEAQQRSLEEEIAQLNQVLEGIKVTPPVSPMYEDEQIQRVPENKQNKSQVNIKKRCWKCGARGHSKTQCKRVSKKTLKKVAKQFQVNLSLHELMKEASNKEKNEVLNLIPKPLPLPFKSGGSQMASWADSCK